MRTTNSAAGLESIDQTVVLTRGWIDELDTSLGWCNRHRSYRLLRAVLRTLRDCLPAPEMAELGAQLPQLLRGVYYEGWQPAATPLRPRSGTDFMTGVGCILASEPNAVTPEAVAAVFALLMDKLSDEVGAALRHALPAEISPPYPPARQAA